MTKKIISLILVIATLLSVCALTVSAADGEEYISEVALIYEDSVTLAKLAITGTDWKLYEKDLNPDADFLFDDGVYLIYKTSTNVEDAITDLRVMDMYGGYSTSNYKDQLEASRMEYLAICKGIRTAATEFKQLYDMGDEMAKIAYRQMNYYKDVGGTDMLMGDFMLNIPSDEALVTAMMEGNMLVVANLMTLLAIGISGGGNGTLAERIAANYENKDAFNTATYYDVAAIFMDDFRELAAVVKRYNALADQYDLTDEDMSEEECDFLLSYASVAMALEEIPYGEGTLKDFMIKDDLTVQDICPIIGAFTEGQLALSDVGVLTTVLQHNTLKPTDDMYKLLAETEKELTDENGNLTIIDVYVGVDRSIFDGDFAFTTAAERQQALTGYEWTSDNFLNENKGLYIASISLAASGAVFIVAPIVYVKIVTVVAKSMLATGHSWFAYSRVARLSLWLKGGYGQVIAGAGKYFVAAGVGLLVAAIGIAGISLWYGYYNPDYTAIPNTMVDVRETDTGDKYIKYTAAKVFEEGELSEKNADFNAYEGKEWNALYYTKDANAGNCLTPNFVFSDSSSAVVRRHQGISMFGETNAFNLNSHVFNADAKGAYLTVRYSTAKKSAANVPTVVGSIFSGGGLYVVAALGGAVVGIGGTLLLQKAAKAKKKEAA